MVILIDKHLGVRSVLDDITQIALFVLAAALIAAGIAEALIENQ